MKKARLIVTYKCPKNCEGCCNKNWKYEEPQEIKTFKYDEILITGGEPLLFLDNLKRLIIMIRQYSNAKIILYTAQTKGLIKIIPFVDGLTLTLHDKKDVEKFKKWIRVNACRMTFFKNYDKKTFRLNVFNMSKLSLENFYEHWFEIKFVDWVKDCPLPEDEVLLKLKELW